MTNTVDIKAYMATHPDCGGIVYVGVDLPDMRKNNAKEIAACIKRGMSISHVTVEVARGAKWCMCKRGEEVMTDIPVDIGLIERLRDEAALCRNETAVDIAELLEEAVDALTAAEKDAARLDWLDSLGFTAYCNRDPETRERGHVVFVNEDAKGGRKGIVRQTIREAIDQAMGEANGR